MVTEKRFGSHQTIVPLAIETSLVVINQLVLVTFGCQLDNWPIGDQNFLVAFKFEEWQPNFFSR
jgi:hypothetical protein